MSTLSTNGPVRCGTCKSDGFVWTWHTSYVGRGRCGSHALRERCRDCDGRGWVWARWHFVDPLTFDIGEG